MEPYENNMPINPLSESPLYRVLFQPDKKDYVTSRENAIEKDYTSKSSNMTQVLLVILFYVFIAIVALLFLEKSQERKMEYVSEMVYALTLGGLAVGYWALQSFFKKRKLKKEVNTSAVESGEVDTPTRLSLYRDRLQLSNQLSNSEYLYDNITVNENAEGLAILLGSDVVSYVPARFFDRNTAFQITSFLGQKLGARYRREAYMQVGVTAQSVAEVAQEEAPLYEFNFVTCQKDTRPIAGRDAWQSVLLFVLGFGAAMLVTWLLGKYVWKMFYIAMVTIGGLFVTMVIGVTYGLIIQLFKKEFPETVYQKYFHDRMKITVRNTETTIPYDKIKKVGFFKDSVVIDTKDGKWQYVPKAQFANEQKAQKFVQFLQERISESNHQ